MHREDVIQQLRTYEEKWADEASTVQRFVDFISSHAECFERTLPVGHVTGSAWVVNAAGTHVLLTHHRKLNRWLQLGGHADGDSDVLRVALREVLEESGLDDVVPVSIEIFDIDVHPIPARGTEPLHDHYDIRYAMQARGDEAYTVSEESHDLDWIAVESLGSVTQEESMLRMAEKWVSARL